MLLAVVLQGLPCPFNKLHRTVTEIMDSNEAIDDSKLDSLSTSVEKLQWKARAIGELDTKIAG